MCVFFFLFIHLLGWLGQVGPVAGLPEKRILIVRIRHVDHDYSVRVEGRLPLILSSDGDVELLHRLVIQRLLEDQSSFQATRKAKEILQTGEKSFQNDPCRTNRPIQRSYRMKSRKNGILDGRVRTRLVSIHGLDAGQNHGPNNGRLFK